MKKFSNMWSGSALYRGFRSRLREHMIAEGDAARMHAPTDLTYACASPVSVGHRVYRQPCSRAPAGQSCPVENGPIPPFANRKAT